MLALASIMSSCSKKEMEDDLVLNSSPFIYFHIYVHDEEGHNLVNENLGLTLTFEGATYELGPWQPREVVDAKTRNASQYELYRSGDCIVFGSLIPDKEWDTDFVLAWADGSSNVIHLDVKEVRTEDKKGWHTYYAQHWTLDGKEYKDSFRRFYFIKSRPVKEN